MNLESSMIVIMPSHIQIEDRHKLKRFLKFEKMIAEQLLN